MKLLKMITKSRSDICFKCNSRKQLTSFYRHEQMANGHLGKCKKCTKLDTIKNRNKRLEYYRQYDINRSKLPHRIRLRIKTSNEWQKKYPRRRKSQIRVVNAVRDGRLKKQKQCSRCNKKIKLHGHHPDYRKPLYVIWLCVSCHKREHLRKDHK